MDPSSLTPAELEWLVEDERRWQRARAIAERHPHLDVSGLYHTIRNMERTPEERLARGLAHGRLRPR